MDPGQCSISGVESDVADADLQSTSEVTRFNSAVGVTEVDAPAPVSGHEEHSLERELSKVSAQTVTEKGTEIGFLWEIVEALLWLVMFSILGVLARIGLSALESYPGRLVDPLLWVQFVGCVVMGALAEIKSLFVIKGDRSLQVYIGMTTGFCGSMTTFSAWMKNTFLSMANVSPQYERPRGYSVLGLMNGIIATLCLSLAGIKAGGHVGIFMNHVWVRMHTGRFGRITGRRTVPALQVLALVLGAGCWIGSVLMAVFISKWRGTVLFALVFGPLGTMTRWLLARYLNRLYPSFPMGTFAANVIGTILIGVFSIAQQRVDGVTGCYIFQGLMDGYCGCLTTVSTFALELQTLQRRHSWRYGGVSIVIGMLVMCLTIGVDDWHFHKYTERRC